MRCVIFGHEKFCIGNVKSAIAEKKGKKKKKMMVMTMTTKIENEGMKIQSKYGKATQKKTLLVQKKKFLDVTQQKIVVGRKKYPELIDCIKPNRPPKLYEDKEFRNKILSKFLSTIK